MTSARGPAPATERALVVRVDFGSCALRAEDGRMLEAPVRGRVMGKRKSLGNAVVVGDMACWTPERERIVISGVEPRRNVFSRRASGELMVSYPLTRIGGLGLYVFGQAFTGYGEALDDWDHNGTHARIGIAFTR